MALRLIFLFALIAAAQDQPLIRVNTRLVEVDVIVRNSAGPVTGLTEADFTILDNGKPQKVAIFGVSNSASRKPSPLPDGVVANRLNPAGEVPAGITVVLFDRLNTEFRDQTEARRHVLKYLATLNPTDRVAIYSLNKTLSVVQDFTEDPQKLLKAVNKAGGEASVDLSAPDLITDLALSLKTPAAPNGDPIADGMTKASAREMVDRAKLNRAEITASTFETIAKHLSGLPGRKKLVWITSAFEAQYTDIRSRNGADQIETRNFADFIEKAARKLNDANVAVYPIDPRDPYNGGFNATGIDTMNLFAGKTGGRAQYVISDIAEAMRNVDRENEVVYRLGFYPKDDNSGGFHSINVKVARKGVTLSYRKGYFAGDTRASTPKLRAVSLNEAFLNQLEATAIGLTGSARRDAAQPGFWQLSVNIDLTQIRLALEKGRWVALIAMATEFPAKGHPNGTLEEIKITLTEERLKECLAKGFQLERPFLARSLMGPLRVAIQDRNTGEIGSLTLSLRN